MRISLNNNEFIEIECCWQSKLSPKKECFVEYGNLDEHKNKIVKGTFYTNFVEILKALSFSPYQIKALINYLYDNEAVLSVVKTHSKMRHSIQDRITQEKIIVSEDVAELINKVLNQENNASV